MTNANSNDKKVHKTTKASPKVKAAAAPKVKAAPKMRLFKNNDYDKPSISERIIGTANDAWNQVKSLEGKHISEWNKNEVELFIRAMNNFVSISHAGTNGNDAGTLSDMLQQVTSYLQEGRDEEMQFYLDPIYIVVDWTATLLPVTPNLVTVLPALGTVVILPSGQKNCYIVPSLTDGNFLLGQVVQRWPGVCGFCIGSPLPLELRG